MLLVVHSTHEMNALFIICLWKLSLLPEQKEKEKDKYKHTHIQKESSIDA